MKEVKELSQNVYYDTAATSYLYNKDIFDISIKIIEQKKYYSVVIFLSLTHQEF